MIFLDKETRKELNKEEILRSIGRTSDEEVTYEDIISLIDKGVFTRVTLDEKIKLCKQSAVFSLDDNYYDCILVYKVPLAEASREVGRRVDKLYKKYGILHFGPIYNGDNA